MGLLPTLFSVKRKSLFVSRILDGLEIALDQSEDMLHRPHARKFTSYHKIKVYKEVSYLEIQIEVIFKYKMLKFTIGVKTFLRKFCGFVHD